MMAKSAIIHRLTDEAMTLTNQAPVSRPDMQQCSGDCNGLRRLRHRRSHTLVPQVDFVFLESANMVWDVRKGSFFSSERLAPGHLDGG
jgi:hypothetical protein